jgi:hypothetical protein
MSSRNNAGKHDFFEVWMRANTTEARFARALNRFGSRERQLSAASLIHDRDILIALYGEEWTKTSALQQKALAKKVEAGIRAVIADYAEGPEKRAAEVVFAAAKEFHGLLVKERIAVVESSPDDRAFTHEQYERLRLRVVTNMCGSLPHVLDNLVHTELLGDAEPECTRSLRQLFRYAQQAAVLVDAHATCVAHSAKARKNIEGCSALPLIPGQRTPWGDEALWALSHCLRYLHIAKADPQCCEYLRERIAVAWWGGSQLSPGLTKAQSDVLISIAADRGSVGIDEAINGLCESDVGMSTCSAWYAALKTPIHARRLRSNLVEVCATLETLFPEESMRAAEAGRIYRDALLLLHWECVHEADIFPDDGEDHAVPRGLTPSMSLNRYGAGLMQRIDWSMQRRSEYA